MVGIGTSMEVAFELRPKRQEEQGRNISAGGEAVVYSVLYLLPGISKNSSVVVDTVSFLWLFITCSGRIQKWLPPPKAISIFIYCAISTSLELLISSASTTFSQDPSKGWWGCNWVPKAFSEPKCFPWAPDFITCYPSVHCRHNQAFNSIESFSWYKLLSFTIIFNTLTHRIR